MSKLEKQIAMPRRRLFKPFEEKPYLPIRESPPKVRKAKKAKAKR